VVLTSVVHTERGWGNGATGSYVSLESLL
jgi:hypothetical protein